MKNTKKIILSFLMSLVVIFSNTQISNAANVSLYEKGVMFLVYQEMRSVIQEYNSMFQTELSIGNVFRKSTIDYGDYVGYVSKFYQNGVNYGQINFYVDGQHYVNNIRFISYANDNGEITGYITGCSVIALGMTPDETMEIIEKLENGETQFNIYCESKDCYFNFSVENSDMLYIDLSAFN